MLTDNSALRLYRLQSLSQVLLHLGGDSAPTPQEPIPTPVRRKAKMALRALASRVSAKGKRIEAFPVVPKGAPFWNGKVSIPTPLKREDQAALTERLVKQHNLGKVPQIFMAGTLSNKGRHDDKSIATAAAVLYHNKTEWGHTKCTLGEKLTRADIEAEMLRPVLRLLADFVTETNYTGPVQMITGSPSAPHSFLNFKQHATQHVSLEFAQKIDSFLADHPQVTLTIEYAKHNPELVGFKRAQSLTLEAVKRPLTNAQRPPSIHYQRAETEAAAVEAWEQRYQENPQCSQAYNSALVAPLDGQIHMILKIASTGLRKKGHTFSHRVPRTVQSSLICLITGHAFIGAYRLKFQRKNLPPATEEEVACACGAVPEDTEHILLHCPLTHDQRLRHLSADGLPDSLRKLFDSPRRCLGLLRFLEETHVCAKPRRAWEPG